MPDVIGYSLEKALYILNEYNSSNYHSNVEIIVKETFGKKDTKTDDVRVLRQNRHENNLLELVIAYF